MNQLQIRKGLFLQLLVSVFFFVILYGCKKNDHLSKSNDLTNEFSDLQKPQAKESADVVYDWYNLIAKLQRPANPQPVVIFNYRNFGFIGVGLYEAVQPGIKTAKSLSEVLYQMPDMPATDKHEDYLWVESANAALASMFKQFLSVNLTPANIFSIDSMENAQYNKFNLTTPTSVLNRSRDYGRAVANAIFNWSTTDNFSLGATGYVPPVCPSCWVSTSTPPVAPVGPYLKDSRPFLEYSLTGTTNHWLLCIF